MNYILKITLLVLVVVQFGCVKDPFKEFEEGSWNNERSILEIQFEHQVGAAQIERDGPESGTITLGINELAVDFSSVKLSSLVVSYDANASVAVGETLNFDNTEKSATVSVTSPTGLTRDYTIILEPFTETLVGTYEVTGLVVWGGTGPEYGGGAVLAMMDKPWAWDETTGPAAELDNTITFELGGFTANGNSYGTLTHSAGADGLYADYVFVLDPQTDVNHHYRKLPTGEAQWERNYATGKVTFTWADGSTSSCVYREAPTTIDVGFDRSKTVENQAFEFVVDGVDDWDNIYTDYDKFVKRPRTFWVDVKKQ
ncbi:hypothetical protein [Marinoscillum furvescens]|uniref:Uncharacterized protein n=1 Tax=Marinoscillum furvescens DSM 4134 TaxID=1122208 RepID=A0A3D9L060_MARFU|nr:hypothetical protein [Marinoscillum furvescens]RED95301.1 hypothetical protein C7460_11878 [Marinoscillum furvescens DSM 4134]